MKKLLILLFSILISFNSYGDSSDETICVENAGYINGIIYLPNETKPFTGKNLCKYENGQIRLEGNYKDGKHDGKFSSWHENTQKWEEGNYKDGKQDGKWIWWYENGQKQAEENYKDGIFTYPDNYSSYERVNGDVGCGSTYSKEKRTDVFNSKYKNHWFKWRGEILIVSSDNVSLNVDNFGIQDLSVYFKKKGAGYNLREGQWITVRFLMKTKGGCWLPFGGERATIVY